MSHYTNRMQRIVTRLMERADRWMIRAIAAEEQNKDAFLAGWNAAKHRSYYDPLLAKTDPVDLYVQWLNQKDTEPPRILSHEERIQFRKDWDARVRGTESG